MASDTQSISRRLDVIKSELEYIKENMATKDMFLTSEEKKLLDESYKNEKEGNLISSKDLRKKIGI